MLPVPVSSAFRRALFQIETAKPHMNSQPFHDVKLRMVTASQYQTFSFLIALVGLLHCPRVAVGADSPASTLRRNGRENVLIDAPFSGDNGRWKSVALSGNGQLDFEQGRLNVASDAKGIFGAFHDKKLSGHFLIEVDFSPNDQAALAIFRANGDRPDLNNYSMIRIEKEGGVPVLAIQDVQNGKRNVLDCTGAADRNRYQLFLDGKTHSVPFTDTNHRFRILRHAGEKFIHFYYQVKKNVRGKEAIGWMELAPSKEWPQLDGDFLMGLLAVNGSASFDNAFAMSKPIDDIDDSHTGFKAVRREFNWSGYHGDALVVSFDKNDAPLTDGTRKFVFWEQANFVPSWFLDNELLQTFEFVETWGGGNPGCHEPMSDRLNRFSDVTLEHDGADYKLVHWQYALVDSDYKSPDDASGTQIPMCDEWFKIYPDGTILRRIRYKAKLDSKFRNWHELTELILVAGKNTDPSNQLASPSLTIWPLSQKRLDFIPKGRGAEYEKSHDDATVLGVHFKKHPSVVCAFNDNAAQPKTFAGYPITFYKTWHDQDYHMSHWPINKERYHTDFFKSTTTWKQQVKHTSLAGAGVYGGSEWSDQTQTDPDDGRKYREWHSIISLIPQAEFSSVKPMVKRWLKNPSDWRADRN